MGFHEVQLPTNYSYQSGGGPGFSTQIIETDSGAEERVGRWAQARRQYDLAENIKSFAQLQVLLDFYVARQGALYGFRLKDWLDYSTNPLCTPDNPVAPTNLDVIIGTGNGTLKTFQLIVKYTSGSITRIRNIEKPVSGTITLALAGVAKVLGTDYTLDTTTGIITFTTAPALGISITCGFEFDVPVRFSEELDKNGFRISIEDFSNGNIPSVPCVEIRNETASSDEFYYGGASTFPNINADIAISPGNGRAQRIECNTNCKGILPDATYLEAGGPWFYITNTGTATLTIVNSALATVIVVPTTATVVIFMSKDVAGNKTWYAK